MPARRCLAAAGAMLLCAVLTAQPQSLTTLFTSNNGGSAGWVVMFDATVAAASNPRGLRIVELDANCSTASANATVDVWMTPNTYVGVERNPAAWIHVASGVAVTTARNSPTRFDISDFVLPPGTWGLGIQVGGGSGQAYTDGNGSNQSYADANLSLSLGASLASQFLTTGLLFTPRVWNGTIYYATASDAVFGPFGSGCAGSNGVPTLQPATGSRPSLGQVLQLDLGNGPQTPGFALFGFGLSKTIGLGLPLPLDLTPLGMPGCSLLVDPLLQLTNAVVNGASSITLPVPNNPLLLGLQLYSQALVFDPPANAAGFIASNGAEGQVGL